MIDSIASTKFALVPAELQRMPQWVCWRFETVNGKITKVPYTPGGTHASTTDPSTWADFETCAKHASHFDGIGIVFANGLAGIDLDKHVDENGTLSPMASEIVNQIETYTEFSPSGTGLHFLAFGTLPEGKRKNKQAGIEMYDRGRFFTVTGKHCPLTPLTVETRTAELAAIHAKYLGTIVPTKDPGTRAPTQSISLSDKEILERAFHSRNGADIERLYRGDTTGHNGDKSGADIALCNHLAFWTGNDAERMDRLFRGSGLMRDKWDERHSADGRSYGVMTIEKSIAGTPEIYNPPAAAQPKASSNGHTETEAPMQGQSVHEKKITKRKDYLRHLEELGFAFRLNLVGSIVEVNGTQLTDELEAEIRVQMRDRGFTTMQALRDVYIAEAARNAHHPVRDYLNALQWDKQKNIAELAKHFTDRDKIFATWLRKWVIGAVAKVFEGGQNAMLVLDGPQDIGKSHFARWLCPLTDYFLEGPIDPTNKDADIRLMTKWIWEVSELGATIRRADREALKFFITQHKVTVRKPYGRNDTTGLAMASLIGTINNEAGFLADPTGSRRFLVSRIETIDWNYTKLNVAQIWAEAVAAYRGGEKWILTTDEAKQRDEINKAFEIDDPIAAMIDKYFELDPNGEKFMPSLTILKTLEAAGLRGGTAKSNMMAIAASMKKLGFENVRATKAEGDRRRGFNGVTARKGAPIVET